MKIFLQTGLLLIFLTANLCFASDWPRYLGPNGNAVSKEKGLKRSWDENGPEILWTFPLTEGFGGPAVSEGKVYIYDRVENEKNVLRCLDITNGNEEWTFTYDVTGKISYNGSRSIPTIDGSRIYVCDPFGNFHCLDKNTHKVIWHKNIWTDFGGTELPRWGIAQHPQIYNDLVIVASQAENAGVVAYEKQTGEIRWKTEPLPGKPGYVTPKLVKIGQEDHLVMISALGTVRGFNPKTGKKLWSYDGWQCKIPIPNVTEIGDGRLFITGGYDAGSAMIMIKKVNPGYQVEELFKTTEFGTHVHPAILYKGHLYGHCTTNTTKDGLVCMDLKGTVKWKTKSSPNFDKGGFILADDMLISMDGTKGNLYLIEPTPVEFKPLSTAKLLDTTMCWAPLTLSNGKLLIRDQKQMKCIQLKKDI